MSALGYSRPALISTEGALSAGKGRVGAEVKGAGLRASGPAPGGRKMAEGERQAPPGRMRRPGRAAVGARGRCQEWGRGRGVVRGSAREGREMDDLPGPERMGPAEGGAVRGPGRRTRTRGCGEGWWVGRNTGTWGARAAGGSGGQGLGQERRPCPRPGRSGRSPPRVWRGRCRGRGLPSSLDPARRGWGCSVGWACRTPSPASSTLCPPPPAPPLREAGLWSFGG